MWMVLCVIDLVQGLEIELGLIWCVMWLGGGEEVFMVSDVGVSEIEVVVGVYDVFVVWLERGLSGLVEIVQVV